jgi:hypothetical protein
LEENLGQFLRFERKVSAPNLKLPTNFIRRGKKKNTFVFLNFLRKKKKEKKFFFDLNQNYKILCITTHAPFGFYCIFYK